MWGDSYGGQEDGSEKNWYQKSLEARRDWKSGKTTGGLFSQDNGGTNGQERLFGPSDQQDDRLKFRAEAIRQEEQDYWRRFWGF